MVVAVVPGLDMLIAKGGMIADLPPWFIVRLVPKDKLEIFIRQWQMVSKSDNGRLAKETGKVIFAPNRTEPGGTIVPVLCWLGSGPQRRENCRLG